MRADAASLLACLVCGLQTIRNFLLLPVLWGVLFSVLPGFATAQPSRNEELHDVYKKWLQQDVIYIINPEEKSVFEGLTTDAERDRFIEQFWKRRDPTPRDGVNEFQIEHYRRIAYSNENFRSGLPGWATDRGRIYITLGPPDSVERNPTGGKYDRRLSEGGGSTTTHPFERWFYRHIDGVGDGIELEFVDPTVSGEYRLALRDSEKDAFFHVGLAGLTLGEEMGLTNRTGRVRSDLLMRPSGLPGESAFISSDNPFDRLVNHFDIMRPPRIEFADLKTVVGTRVTYDNLPVRARADWFPMTESHRLVFLTLEIPSHHLTYRRLDQGLLRTEAHIYGVIENLNRKVAYEFEEELYREVREGPPKKERILFQKKTRLQPGRYKLTAAVKDVTSSEMGTLAQGFVIPPSQPQALLLSSILLAEQVLPPEKDRQITDPFVIWGGYKFFPTIGSTIVNRGRIAVYFEVSELEVDQAAQGPEVTVSGGIYSPQGELLRSLRLVSGTELTPNHIAFLSELDLSRLPRSRYVLRVNIKDDVSGRAREQSVPVILGN